MGGKGNDGVAAFVKQTSGAIGYVEYAYAKQNQHGLCPVMQNKAGKWVAPTAANFAAAAAGAKWSDRSWFLPASARSAWRQRVADNGCDLHPDAQQADEGRQTGHDVLAFFDWAYKNGDERRGRIPGLCASAGPGEGPRPQVLEDHCRDRRRQAAYIRKRA